MKKILLSLLFTVSVILNANAVGYNDYLTSASSGSSMTQIGSVINKQIGFYLKNNGTESITITKLIIRNASTLNEVSTSTDASTLGELSAGATKTLSCTVHQDIDLVYDWEYTYKGETFTFKSYNYEVIKVSGITLNKSALSIKTGESATLVATVSPENAKFKDVAWTSSNKNVASVDASGNVMAIGEGTATITATSTDGSNVSASCTVTVEKAAEEAEEDYNYYLASGSDGYSISQIGSRVTKSINMHISNNGSESIYITKLTWVNSSTKVTLGSSDDTSLLGTLNAGGKKSLSITIRQDIDLAYIWEYTYKGSKFVFNSWESYPVPASVNKAAAQKVIDKIEAIGTVENTETCKTKIDLARNAYNALTDTQKALVTNYDTLTAAEKAYTAAGIDGVTVNEPVKNGKYVKNGRLFIVKNGKLYTEGGQLIK